MYTFNVPVPKLGITVPVSVPTEEQLRNHAEHGVRQRINDTLAGHARKPFANPEAYHDAGLRVIAKIIAKIEAGLVGQRTAVVKTLAEQLEPLSDAELAKLGLVRAPVADAA